MNNIPYRLLKAPQESELFHLQIKIFSHLNETGAINMQLSKGGVVVEKIDIKGEKLEEYFMDRVGGEVSV